MNTWNCLVYSELLSEASLWEFPTPDATAFSPLNYCNVVSKLRTLKLQPWTRWVSTQLWKEVASFFYEKHNWTSDQVLLKLRKLAIGSWFSQNCEAFCACYRFYTAGLAYTSSIRWFLKISISRNRRLLQPKTQNLFPFYIPLRIVGSSFLH